MKVYVIEKGEYSARHVVAVKETVEEAEELVRFLRRYQGESELDPIDITPYDTDDFSFIKSGDAYVIVANRNGDIESIRKMAEYSLENLDDWAAYDIDEPWKYEVKFIKGYRTVEFCVVAKDEAHALKIASDKLAEYKYRTKVEEAE